MADKPISELIAAEQITATDMFVLEQNGTAKKLTGQVLLNWLTAAADGHGGIQSISKLNTSGLADTYQITLADTTTFDFVVTNGRSVSSISKTGTSGLVDTYRISYNDGNFDTFTVTNGEKGDKGDNAYIWIKFASQEPTASSHSFGDVPDNWMGVYFGIESAAPTDWQQYKWFKIKGEKGDTGEPATLVSSQVTYQVGDSGTIIPSGSWQTSVPSVTPGKFLWTRQVLQFNTGAPITSYSVSRFGIDGSGAVSSVAGVAPDGNGNVHLDASSVKALPIGGGTMEGAINMNGQPIRGLNAPTEDSQAATKGYVDTNKVDKSKVANEFNVTEEGFVADARALKVLNDGKLSMELLWENAVTNTAFTKQTIPLDLSKYEHVAILFSNAGAQMQNVYFPMDLCKVGTKTLIYHNIGQSNIVGDAMQTYGRDVTVTETGISFGTGYSTSGSSPSEQDRGMVPYKIYGIKGALA